MKERGRVHFFAQAIHEGIEGSEVKVYNHYRERNKATVATKPSESQKANALWKRKVAKEHGGVFYESYRKDKILGKI